MKIRAVIFDLDGVIADSEPLSGEGTKMVLERHGITMTDRERKEAIGRRLPDIFSDVLEVRGKKLSIEELMKERDRIFEGLVRKHLKAIPGSLELLQWLKDNGYRLALATSSHGSKMQLEVDHLGIGKFFDVVVCGDDVRKGKPDPEIFLKAAEKLGMKPEECAVVEDSEFGVQAAKFAGMKAIAFDSPNTHNQDISGADAIIKDIGEVKEHLE